MADYTAGAERVETEVNFNMSLECHDTNTKKSLPWFSLPKWPHHTHAQEKMAGGPRSPNAPRREMIPTAQEFSLAFLRSLFFPTKRLLSYFNVQKQRVWRKIPTSRWFLLLFKSSESSSFYILNVWKDISDDHKVSINKPNRKDRKPKVDIAAILETERHSHDVFIFSVPFYCSGGFLLFIDWLAIVCWLLSPFSFIFLLMSHGALDDSSDSTVISPDQRPLSQRARRTWSSNPFLFFLSFF